MTSDPASITSYLHQQMPLTQAMGVRVIQADDDRALITAPLKPNLNHQQTAFGGSIAALGITAGWVYLHCRLETLGLNVRLIIQKSQVEYLQPVEDDFEASCVAPSAQDWEAFVAMLRKRGRARMERVAQIQCRGRIVAVHHGSYVAIDQHLARKRGVRG